MERVISKQKEILRIVLTMILFVLIIFLSQAVTINKFKHLFANNTHIMGYLSFGLLILLNVVMLSSSYQFQKDIRNEALEKVYPTKDYILYLLMFLIVVCHLANLMHVLDGNAIEFQAYIIIYVLL